MAFFVDAKLVRSDDFFLVVFHFPFAIGAFEGLEALFGEAELERPFFARRPSSTAGPGYVRVEAKDLVLFGLEEGDRRALVITGVME